MDTFFDDIATSLKGLIAEAKVIAKHFDIATDHIEVVKPLKLATVEDFFLHLFGVDADMPDLPFGEATIDHFLVARANASLGLPTRADIAVSFNNTAMWEAAPGLAFALQSFELDYWGGSITGSVAGSVTVQEVEFDASVRWPSLAITGHLAANPASPHNATSLMGRHGLGATGTPSIDLVRLHAAPRVHAISIDVAGSNLVTIGPVHLDTAAVSINYEGGPNAAFTGELSAEFSAAGVAFALRGAKTAKGWEAEAAAVATTTVAGIVDGLASHFFPAGGHSLADYGVPEEIAAKTVTGAISLTASTADRHVTLNAIVDVSNGTGTMQLEVDIAPNSLVVRAELHLGDLSFEVDFAKDTNGTLLAAQFVSEHALEVHLKELVDLAHIGGGSSTLPVGTDVTIGVRDVLIAMASPAATKPPTPGAKAKYLVAADVDGGIDLSGLGDLPLIGEMLPRDLSLRLSLAPVLVTGSWVADQAALDELRGDNGPHLPAQLTSSALGVSLQLPGNDTPVDMGISLGDMSAGDDVAIDTAATPSPATDSSVTWKTINKTLGPVSIERVGLGLDKSNPADPEVRVLLDSSLGLGPLSLSLVGLGARYGLKSKHFSVELHGMGIEFKKPPLEIAGAFAEISGDYLGKVKLQLETIGIAASGGFTTIDGTPSMFVYGVLTTPIGGPPFFFVEGLAAGFGFNRRLTVPELSHVHSFPFVTDAISVADGDEAPSMSEALESLAASVQPALGEYFLAAGIKFTSFKLIDSFILVMISAGRDLKIDALGFSSYQSPPLVPAALPAMVRIELEISVAVRPAQGFVRVQAALTKNSYVYTPVVQLSGGFAFQAWFAGEHAGDFVVSAGGYHPDFKKPKHYPDVRRIALTFKVPFVEVYIKGQAYFALTPSMMMAGGSLEAVAKFGKVHASFTMYAHFMIQWEPYHYDAKFGISIKARWWKFSTHAHAELHIWGPEFAGFAEVHWSVISFDVSFGPGSLFPFATPISWQKFKDSFLPHDEPKGNRKPVAKVAPTATVTGGEISVIDGPNGPVHLVNPKDLVISIESVMPFQTVKVDKLASEPVTVAGKQVSIGCAPIGTGAVLGSELQLGFSGGNEFTHDVKTKEFPAAMWGQPGAPDINAERTVTAGGSIELRLDGAVNHRGKHKIKRGDFTYDSEKTATVSGPPVFAFSPGSKKLASALVPAERALASKARNAVLSSLGLAPERINLRKEFIDELRDAPTQMAVQ